MKLIFVAKKLFEAYLIISADSTVVETIGVSRRYNGQYNSFIISSDFLFSHPITTLSGRIKSFIAEPSRKNSGLETTSKYFSFIFFEMIFFTSLVVPTGTVDLVTTIQYLLTLLLISSATSQTKDKSASPSILFEGVPTVMKIIK